MAAMESIVVRAALSADAAEAIAVVRASIAELCVADHQNDAATLERWLQNKTAEQFGGWLADPENHVAVAIRGSELVGVALVRASGDINLCYVRPGATGSGVGSALLDNVEAQAQSWGLLELRLGSSCRARAFYERRGYVENGEPSVAFGTVQHFPYRKALAGRAL